MEIYKTISLYFVSSYEPTPLKDSQKQWQYSNGHFWRIHLNWLDGRMFINRLQVERWMAQNDATSLVTMAMQKPSLNIIHFPFVYFRTTTCDVVNECHCSVCSHFSLNYFFLIRRRFFHAHYSHFGTNGIINFIECMKERVEGVEHERETYFGYMQILAYELHGWQKIIIAHHSEKCEEVNGP